MNEKMFGGAVSPGKKPEENREDKYEGGIVESGEKEGRYAARQTVNGIDIDVSWDTDYRGYTLYLPEAKVHSAEAEKLGVDFDNNYALDTDDAEEAKRIFLNVREMARGMENPDALKLLVDFVHGRKREEEGTKRDHQLFRSLGYEVRDTKRKRGKEE